MFRIMMMLRRLRMARLICINFAKGYAEFEMFGRRLRIPYTNKEE